MVASHFPAREEGRLEESPYTAVQSVVVGSVMQLCTAVRSVWSWTRALNITSQFTRQNSVISGNVVNQTTN